eukprot:SAG22_NODE_13555_length_402_cov_1.217822_1_plen_40_part_01
MTTGGDLMAFGQMRPQDQHIWVEFNGPNGASFSISRMVSS